MPTFKEWDEDIQEQELEDIKRYFKALQDLKDWELFRNTFQQYWIFSLIPSLRTQIAFKAKAFCSRCHSSYLNNWEVDDLISVKRRHYEEWQVCPDCFEDLVKEGVINPEVPPPPLPLPQRKR